MHAFPILGFSFCVKYRNLKEVVEDLLTCSSREENPKYCKEVFPSGIIWHSVATEQPS